MNLPQVLALLLPTMSHSPMKPSLEAEWMPGPGELCLQNCELNKRLPSTNEVPRILPWWTRHKALSEVWKLMAAVRLSSEGDTTAFPLYRWERLSYLPKVTDVVVVMHSRVGVRPRLEVSLLGIFHQSSIATFTGTGLWPCAISGTPRVCQGLLVSLSMPLRSHKD